MDIFSKRVRIAVSVVVGSLGLLALTLGVSAEGARQTYCGESNPSTGLAIAAALVLLVSQIIANVCGGCVCCCTYNRPPLRKAKPMVAIICLSLSWIIFATSFTLLFVGALVNPNDANNCGGKLGVMGGGGALTFLSTCAAIAYYLVVTQVMTPSTPVVGHSSDEPKHNGDDPMVNPSTSMVGHSVSIKMTPIVGGPSHAPNPTLGPHEAPRQGFPPLSTTPYNEPRSALEQMGHHKDLEA